MSSEFNCDYCSNMPRRPCHSKEEASKCGNAREGEYLDFDVADVVKWLRYKARYSPWSDETTALQHAANIIEEHL